MGVLSHNPSQHTETQEHGCGCLAARSTGGSDFRNLMSIGLGFSDSGTVVENRDVGFATVGNLLGVCSIFMGGSRYSGVGSLSIKVGDCEPEISDVDEIVLAPPPSLCGDPTVSSPEVKFLTLKLLRSGHSNGHLLCMCR